MPESDDGGRRPRICLPRGNAWKIAYFAAGVLFIGTSRFFLPFWPRFIILAAWAVGLAVLFARQLGPRND